MKCNNFFCRNWRDGDCESPIYWKSKDCPQRKAFNRFKKAKLIHYVLPELKQIKSELEGHTQD